MPQSTQERPFFFTAHGRPLYGVFHMPAGPRPARAVVVHCHSLGAEQMVCYRTEVLAARAAAARGIPVLRFHARGHGDSAGDDTSVTLDGLVEDALAAADEAQRLSQAERVVWLGVRFGALVAAKALRAHRASAALALWEPVHEPESYFRGMLRGLLFSRVSRGQKPSLTTDELLQATEQEGSVDVNGYHLHPWVLKSARGARLGEFLKDWREPTLIAQVQRRAAPAPAHAELARQLESQGAPVQCTSLVDEPAWHFVGNPGWLNPTLAHTTAEWIDGLR